MPLRSSLILTCLVALACGGSPAAVTDISQDALLAAAPSTLILDVRTPEEFRSGHVPHAINIPHDEVASRLSELDAYRETPVVVYCERGGRAARATTILHDAGFEQLQHLDGDMSAWRARGLPSETGPATAPPRS